MSVIVLASGSRYRAQQLMRLGLDFDARPAAIDETPRAGESPDVLALRLAGAKASHVAAAHPDGIIIGSDQVAELDGQPVGKPGGAHANRQQLQAARGRSMCFFTGVCVIAPEAPRRQQHLDTTTVRFRDLDDAEIDRYVEQEQAFDCAGGFKCEARGISLFEAIDTRDPSALIGLPLIALAGMLRRCGVPLP